MAPHCSCCSYCWTGCVCVSDIYVCVIGKEEKQVASAACSCMCCEWLTVNILGLVNLLCRKELPCEQVVYTLVKCLSCFPQDFEITAALNLTVSRVSAVCPMKTRFVSCSQRNSEFTIRLKKRPKREHTTELSNLKLQHNSLGPEVRMKNIANRSGL